MKSPSPLRVVLFLAVIALLAACGPGDDGSTDAGAGDLSIGSGTVVQSRPEPETQPQDQPESDTAPGSDGESTARPVFADTGSEFCDSTGDARIEMAFNGTVIDRNQRTAFDGSTIDWITFAVDAWYTEDLGQQISLWGSQYSGQIGERWLIAASRYSVDQAPGGDVFWCASEPESEEALTRWSGDYDGSVAAGDDQPENEAPSDVLQQIEAARQLWLANRPNSYTITTVVGPDGDSGGNNGRGCGSGSVRRVIDGGQLVQARDLSNHCDVPLDSLVPVERLFDLAAEAAGALQSPVSFDPTYGFITDFNAQDRSVTRWISGSNFSPAAYPMSNGGRQALQQARDRWAASGIGDYRASIDVRCFCDVQGPIDVKVEQGLVTEVSVEASEWYPLRVEEVFDAIEANIDGDHAELAFHPQLGYPLIAYMDPLANASDDEVDYAITTLTPGSADDS